MSIETLGGDSTADSLPIGSVMHWSHEVPPRGWLLCDGSLALRDAYPDLYSTLTSNGAVFPYGANVNGATGELFFRLPDLKNRMIRTPSTSSLPSGFNANVGATGGSNNNTHNHSFTSSVNVVNGLSGGAHNHNHANTGTDAPGLNGLSINASVGAQGGNALSLGSGNASGTAFSGHGHDNPAGHGYGGHGGHGHGVNGFSTVAGQGGHNHGVNVSNGAVSPNATDHQPPYLEVNFVIFAGPNRYYDWWVVGHSSFPTTVAT